MRDRARDRVRGREGKGEDRARVRDWARGKEGERERWRERERKSEGERDVQLSGVTHCYPSTITHPESYTEQ